MKVRCNYCNWSGNDDELNITRVSNYDGTDTYEIESCPNCYRSDYLMDIE